MKVDCISFHVTYLGFLLNRMTKYYSIHFRHLSFNWALIIYIEYFWTQQISTYRLWILRSEKKFNYKAVTLYAYPTLKDAFVVSTESWISYTKHFPQNASSVVFVFRYSLCCLSWNKILRFFIFLFFAHLCKILSNSYHTLQI